MKKYLVVGDPINHSFSPRLHNYWFKQNNINAIYEKKKISEADIEDIIFQIRNNQINGINITVPFKRSIGKYVDELSSLSKQTQSVNTVYKKENKIIGDNTDVDGFKLSLDHINYNANNKKIFILGAGGVVPSIILALKKMGASKIFISNRTKQKAESLKLLYPDIETVGWGEFKSFDMIINATSLGLNTKDKFKIDFSKLGSSKLYYDIIYNPSKTNFLLNGEKQKNQIENGKMMFIFQAQLAFKIWHGVTPKIDNEALKLLDYD